MSKNEATGEVLMAGHQDGSFACVCIPLLVLENESCGDCFGVEGRQRLFRATPDT